MIRWLLLLLLTLPIVNSPIFKRLLVDITPKKSQVQKNSLNSPLASTPSTSQSTTSASIGPTFRELALQNAQELSLQTLASTDQGYYYCTTTQDLQARLLESQTLPPAAVKSPPTPSLAKPLALKKKEAQKKPASWFTKQLDSWFSQEYSLSKLSSSLIEHSKLTTLHDKLIYLGLLIFLLAGEWGLRRHYGYL